MVSLDQIATIAEREQPSALYHKNLLPVIYVTGDVAGREESPVYAMGGTVGLSSRPGQGSRFWFRIPITAVDGTVESVPRPTSESPEVLSFENLTGRRVLLVDDNELNRLVSRELLETAGLVVETAENGAVAMRRSPPAICLAKSSTPFSASATSRKAAQAWPTSSARSMSRT